MSASAPVQIVRRPDYGIDAPGVRRGMFVAGVGGVAMAAAAAWALWSGLAGTGIGSTLAAGLAALGLLAANYGLLMAAYMTYGSRVGKLHTRDQLLDHVAELRPWTGGEAVLDIGCGRGLMVIGAAKRLSAGQQTTGRSGIAVGIDVWRVEDQAANTPAAALDNATIEGVADRVRIDTGDARALPYADSSFDVVVSHWVVHNMDSVEDRLQVLDEMVRVLRPGGVLALADIAFLDQYREHLALRKLSHLHFLDGGLEARVMGVLSGGSYRPQALLGCRP